MVERLIAEAEGQSRPVMIVPTANAGKSISLKVEAPATGPLHRRRHAAAAVRAGPHGRGAGDRQRPRRRHRRQRRLACRRHRPRRHAPALSPTGSRQLAGGRFVRGRDARPGSEALGASADGGDRRPPRGAGAARRGRSRAPACCTPCPARGQRLGEAPFTLGDGETRAVASFDLPLELRNQVTRIEIAGERSAGAVHLLDARSQWHRVGLSPSELARAGAAAAGAALLHRAGAGALHRDRPERRCEPARRHRRPHQAQRIRADAGRHRHAAARRARSGSPNG